jgi:hypothetical protein
MTDLIIGPDARLRTYTATPGQTVFSVPFPYAIASEISVEITGSDGTVAHPTISVTPDGPAQSGTLTLPAGLAGGETVVVFGATAAEREAQFAERTGLPARDINADLNRLVMTGQENRRDINRALRVRFGDAPLPEIARRHWEGGVPFLSTETGRWVQFPADDMAAIVSRVSAVDLLAALIAQGRLDDAIGALSDDVLSAQGLNAESYRPVGGTDTEMMAAAITAGKVLGRPVLVNEDTRIGEMVTTGTVEIRYLKGARILLDPAAGFGWRHDPQGGRLSVMDMHLDGEQVTPGGLTSYYFELAGTGHALLSRPVMHGFRVGESGATARPCNVEGTLSGVRLENVHFYDCEVANLWNFRSPNCHLVGGLVHDFSAHALRWGTFASTLDFNPDNTPDYSTLVVASNGRCEGVIFDNIEMVCALVELGGDDFKMIECRATNMLQLFKHDNAKRPLVQDCYAGQAKPSNTAQQLIQSANENTGSVEGSGRGCEGLRAINNVLIGGDEGILCGPGAYTERNRIIGPTGSGILYLEDPAGDVTPCHHVNDVIVTPGRGVDARHNGSITGGSITSGSHCVLYQNGDDYRVSRVALACDASVDNRAIRALASGENMQVYGCDFGGSDDSCVLSGDIVHYNNRNLPAGVTTPDIQADDNRTQIAAGHVFEVSPAPLIIRSGYKLITGSTGKQEVLRWDYPSGFFDEGVIAFVRVRLTGRFVNNSGTSCTFRANLGGASTISPSLDGDDVFDLEWTITPAGSSAQEGVLTWSLEDSADWVWANQQAGTRDIKGSTDTSGAGDLVLAVGLDDVSQEVYISSAEIEVGFA